MSLTKSQLLLVISRLQSAVGNARSLTTNDRNPNRMADLLKVLADAEDLCVRARSRWPSAAGARSTLPWEGGAE